MKPYVRDTWVEVDLDAIRANVHTIRSHIPDRTQIMAVVKADGYGHGAVEVAREALAAGATALGVAMLDEAKVLRQAGIQAPILVLGYTPIDGVVQASEWDVELTAYHTEWVEEAESCLAQAKAGRPIGIHIKVDTGMGRIGVRKEEELLDLATRLSSATRLKWSGIFTHFACADEEDTAHTLAQHDRFEALLAVLRQHGFTLPTVHCCNTAAAIAFPKWGYDMIRFGIGLYGLYPSMYLKERRDVELTPALSLKTRIVHLKRAEEPMTVSYGATYTAEAGETIATLPIGYADGFPRAFSNRGFALHAGQKVPIVGRVCMDQSMIRITGATADIGDEVVLYGKLGDAEISLDEAAALLGTINYEVPCMLNYRVPRVYKREGQLVSVSHQILRK